MKLQAKKMPVIKKGTTMSYDPATFKAPANYYEIEDPLEILERVQPYKGKYIVIDTETHPTELHSHDMSAALVRRWVGSGKTAKPQDFPFCLSICDGTNCFSIYDSYENKFAKFKALAPLLTNEDIEKIFHNAKFDLHMLANADVPIAGKIHDTVVLTKITDENRKSFKLRDIAAEHPEGMIVFEYMVDAYKRTHKVVDYRHFPKPLLTAYANADVWNCFIVFAQEFDKLEDMKGLYENELELMMALWEMERIGMKLDANYEAPLKESLQAAADKAEAEIYKVAGKLFNINSSAQLYKVLIELGTDPTLIKKTAKGNPSLNAAALDLLASHNIEIVKHILEFRKATKLLNTYAVGIYSQHDANYRVHGSINQTEATTGRMSVTKPALQTLNKKDTRIRKAFIPADGYELVLIDLDQVEYRIFSHYAKAEGLIQAIIAGKDVHTAAAELVFGTTEPTPEQRAKAKTINFSLLYGAGNAKMAVSLDMTVSEATRFKHHYFAQIPEAEPFINTVKEVTKQRGYIRNLYNRRRRLSYEESYKAPNALIQSCAADYLKYKIVDIHKFLNSYKTRMLMICHDEIIFELHHTEKHLIPVLKEMLSDYTTYRVPITAGVEIGGPSWGEKTPL